MWQSGNIPWHRALIVAGTMLPAVCGLSGCEMGTSTSSSPAQLEPADTRPSPPAIKNPDHDAKSLVTDKNGRKSLDGIPYDVWFDDPLAVVADTSSAVPEKPASPDLPPDNRPAEPSAPTETAPAADAAGIDWTKYITMDQVQEEAKRIRNQLKASLQTPAAYSSDFEAIKMNGAVMAALAVVVQEAGDGVSWKPNAAYLRDFGHDLYAAAQGPAKPHYDKANEAYQNLQAILSGSIPAGAAEPEAQRPFADVASQFYLMRRMKLAFEALKLNINTESRLKSDQEAALADAMILAALSKIISTEGYSSADEADYQAFAKEMLDQCQSATQAVKDQDFLKFQDAINKIEKSCGECHAQYRNG